MTAIATTGTTSLIAFTLPGTPYSVQLARFCIRAALTCHDLGDYAEDAEMVTSELVTNAIRHAAAPMFGLEVMRGGGGEGTSWDGWTCGRWSARMTGKCSC